MLLYNLIIIIVSYTEIDVPGSKKMATMKQPTTPITPSPNTKTPQETTPLPTPTPDYAAALGTDDTSIQPHTPSIYNSNFSGFPSLNSPLTPNPSFVSPPPTATVPNVHPLSTRTQATTSTAAATTQSGEISNTEGEATTKNPDYLNKMLTTTKPPVTASNTVVATNPQLNATSGTNPIVTALHQQLASLGANILGSAAAQNVISNQNRQQLLQNQQRILMERQKLLQIQQQNLLQAANQQLSQSQQLSQQSTSSTATPQQTAQQNTAKPSSKGLKLSVSL